MQEVGNVREKFPWCPSFARSSFYLELYNRKYSERRPKRGNNSFVKLSKSWLCFFVIMQVHSLPRLISTKTEMINPFHKSFWNPGCFSETKWLEIYSSPLENLFITAPLFPNRQWEKKSWECVPSLGTGLLGRPSSAKDCGGLPPAFAWRSSSSF